MSQWSQHSSKCLNLSSAEGSQTTPLSTKQLIKSGGSGQMMLEVHSCAVIGHITQHVPPALNSTSKYLDSSERQNQIRAVVFDMHKQNRVRDLQYDSSRWNLTSEILFCECFMQRLHTRPPPLPHQLFRLCFLPSFPVLSHSFFRVLYPSVSLHTSANPDAHSNSYQNRVPLERV